ncbi:aminopeptidase P N-terminal domain-containing protein [Aquimarina agarivorans]|uniref:aminopeptidase P N-terminal domain-containing protein n=1 Tax=Aquimarina agarivorans TaxID=980584 RepID=UPI000248E710|nr:aminopeptidase P N-terminal domain-containing protein [Aquimarina agarivorans]
MKYNPATASLFIKNRKKFIAQMKSNSLAIFNSNDIYPVSADSTLPFQQHRDIYYLSGLDQEESIVLLFPDAKNEKHKEIAFVKETSAHIAIWEGKKLTKAEVTERSGIETVYWLDDFYKILALLLAEASTIYFNTNEHARANVETQTREDRFIEWCKKKYPAHSVAKSNPILHQLRAVKEPEEIEKIQQACDITEIGFRKVLGMIRPGVWEYEIEAELIYEFTKNRADGFAYTPIVASGTNANVLHYIENNKQCKAGEVILMDTAAAYAKYSSDLTRVVPVSGKFTNRQKEVYNALLNVKKECTNLLTPGLIWEEYNAEITKLITSALIDLKLLDKTDIKNAPKEAPAYRKYFMHGTSHFLGLDTHDYGLQSEPMQANMVLTVEPGIYIPEEKMGFRLEDNVVIQKEGAPLNLMKNIPIEAEEIEALMNS